MSSLGNSSELIYSVMRIIVGLLFALHGSQKLFGFPGGNKVRGSVMLLTAGVIELTSGLLIAVGLFAAPAAFIASGLMAVAYFTAHARHSFWPTVNQGELAVIFCFIFLLIASHGSGVLSVDQLIR